MARKNRRPSAIRRLHRALALSAAVFILFLVVSGLAINHANDLGLEQRKISQSHVLDWYGFGKMPGIRSFVAADGYLSFVGSQIYLNDKHISTLAQGVGAVSHADMLIAAGSEELLLLDHAGELIERLSWLPIGRAKIDALGVHDENAVVIRSAGQVWLADQQLMNWAKLDGESTTTVRWAVPVPSGDSLKKAITLQYRGEGLSMERLLLDFHSGRIFGPVGVLVYDLLALAVGIMAISGLVLWVRGRRNGQRNSRNT